MIKKTKKPITKKCIVCNRTFEINSKKPNYHYHHGVRGNYKRPVNAKTCTKSCSRKYLGNRKAYLKK